MPTVILSWDSDTNISQDFSPNCFSGTTPKSIVAPPVSSAISQRYLTTPCTIVGDDLNQTRISRLKDHVQHFFLCDWITDLNCAAGLSSVSSRLENVAHGCRRFRLFLRPCKLNRQALVFSRVILARLAGTSASSQLYRNTRGFPMYRSSKTIDPLTVGIPDSLPPALTPECTLRICEMGGTTLGRVPE